MCGRLPAPSAADARAHSPCAVALNFPWLLGPGGGRWLIEVGPSGCQEGHVLVVSGIGHHPRHSALVEQSSKGLCFLF